MNQLSLYWGTGDDVEDIQRYSAGGFHPIRLGDVLSSPAGGSSSSSPGAAQQYRVLHKLGSGAFSTVWLGEVLHAPSRHYVALKICVADADPRHELDIFSRIPPETQNMLCLQDSFSLEGPNGVHTVLVHDVLGSLISVVHAVGGRKHTRMLCRQIACGLAALHRHGIVHGDLHAGNVGVALPTLDEHPPQEILEYFGHPECTIVHPSVLPERPEALPPYLVPPISVVDYLKANDPDFAETPLRAEIMDLGNATVIGEQVHPSCTPAAVCAPELMFERVVRSVNPPSTRASDIWSFACTIYELAFGARLFHFAAPNYALLGAMAKLCGEVPSGWKDYWESQEKLTSMNISQEVADKGWQSRREHVAERFKEYTQAEADEIFSLLRSMLKMEPAQRPSAEEVLRHPWFAREDAVSE